MKTDQFSFASDNCAGVHPEVMKALMAANQGYVHSYGEDVYTEQAENLIRNLFTDQAAVFFVYNGTGANVTGITQLIRSYETVFCSETAHIHVDECGSLEHYAGCKLVALPSTNGKITPQQIEVKLTGKGDEHRSQPGMVSITQPTEYGVLYTADEIKALADFVHENGMLLHMDGARIANAAAAMNLSLKALTVDLGVDVLSFGAAKNGIMFGEAVVIFDKNQAASYRYIRKQGMQLHSKMRFIAAQFIALLADDLWLKNALHANSMAQLLCQKISRLPGIKITQPVQCNAVFATFPEKALETMQSRFHFYTWNEPTNEVRLMTSFQTTETDVASFADALAACLK
jgi:threonine aldolase